MNEPVIPEIFETDPRLAPERRPSVLRLVKMPPLRITAHTMEGFTLEEQVTIFQIVMEVLDREEYSSHWTHMERLKTRLQELLTARHWALLGRRSMAYFQKFPDIGSKDEFVSEAYRGLEKGLETYDAEKGKSKEGGCKVTNWIYRHVELRLKDFISQQNHFKLHPRNMKWRTYLSGGYNSRPEYKAEFEEKYGLTTEEARAALFAKFAPIMGVRNISLDERCTETSEPLVDRMAFRAHYPGSAAYYGDSNGARMDMAAIVSDFTRHCKADDLEVWMLIERDGYKQPDVAQLLGISKQEVLNAYRRIERVRQDYLRNLETDEKRLASGESMRPVTTPPRRRGRPARMERLAMASA